MYSIVPALVAFLFLAFGVYVLASRGVNSGSRAFAIVCGMTFAWQFTWAVLFQVENEALALPLAKFGYLLILFLPTGLYHLVTILTQRGGERRWLAASYALAASLGVLLVTGDRLIGGLYDTFFGFYPKAGKLHPLHVAQTVVVALCSAYLLLQQYRLSVSTERVRLRYYLLSLMIYALASIDYLSNYGVEMYPPGVLFVVLSLGIIAQAMARSDLLANPMVLAATIVHEMRTPLATLRNQARLLSRGLPELLAGYEHGLRNGHKPGMLRPGHLDYLRDLGQHIEQEVARSNFIADLLLASAKAEVLSNEGFALHSMQQCVDSALARFPFEESMRERVSVTVARDYVFHGCDTLLTYLIYNLLKNALSAVRGRPQACIEIAFHTGESCNYLSVTDTGHGISKHVLPHVFDGYYSTRIAGNGTGMGLAFCKRVAHAFGGTISCSSVEGQFTTMSLELPQAPAPAPDTAQVLTARRASPGSSAKKPSMPAAI